MASKGDEVSLCEDLHNASGKMASKGDELSLCEDLHNASGISSGRRKRKKLVWKKQLKSLNVLQLSRNASLNTTITRETLRTNNRALARALERTRQELADNNQALLSSEGEKQEIRAELCVLRRVAGLKHDDIDGEVQQRMGNKMHSMRELLHKVSHSLLNTADLITQAMTECEPRLSRGSSLGTIHNVLSPVQDNMLASANDIMRHEIAEDYDKLGSMTGPSTSAGKALRIPQVDLSMITEQSYLMDSSDIQFADEEPDKHLLSAAVRRASRSRSNGSRPGSRSTGSRRSSRRCSDIHTQVLPNSPGLTGHGTRKRASERSSEQGLAEHAAESCNQAIVGVAAAHAEQAPTASNHLPLDAGSASQHAKADRPITSKFAPHRVINTPVNSPNPVLSPFKPDQTEFFTRFVALDVETKKTEKEIKKTMAKPVSKIPKFGQKSTNPVPATNTSNDTDFDDEATEMYSYADWQVAAMATTQDNVTSQQMLVSDASQSGKNKSDTVKDEEETKQQENKLSKKKTKSDAEKHSKPKVTDPSKPTEQIQLTESRDTSSDKTIESETQHERGGRLALPPKTQDVDDNNKNVADKKIQVGSTNENEKSTDGKQTGKGEGKTSKKQRRGTFVMPLPPDESQILRTNKTKRQRKETIVLSAAPLAIDGEKREDKSSSKTQRRGTYVMPKNPEFEPNQPDTRRGTYLVKPANQPETEGSNVPADESEAANIFDEGSSILINSSVDESKEHSRLAPASSELQKNSMNHTNCEEQDMEFTEVFNPAQIAEAIAQKIPNPDFVKTAHEPSFLSTVDSGLSDPSSQNEEDASDENVKNKKQIKTNAKNKPSQETRSKELSSEKKGKSKAEKQIKERKHSTGNTNEVDDDILSADDKENNETKSISKRTENSSSDDTDEKARKKDVSAYFKKPGKICFTAGRRNMQDIMSAKNKIGDKKRGASNVRKTTKGRSKPRLLPSTSPLNASRNGPKGVFDLSLNESIPVPSSISYGQFRERHEALKDIPTMQGATDGTRKQGADVDHGIMLVLGNGKRTKPRRQRGLSVHYAHELTDEHLITPAPRGDEKRVPGLNLGEEEKSTNKESTAVAEVQGKNAGHTPPRKSISKKAKRRISQVIAGQNQTDDVVRTASDAVLRVGSSTDEDSPFVGKCRKRRCKTAVIEDSSDSEVFESPLPGKRSRSASKPSVSTTPTLTEKQQEPSRLAKLKEKLHGSHNGDTSNTEQSLVSISDSDHEPTSKTSQRNTQTSTETHSNKLQPCKQLKNDDKCDTNELCRQSHLNSPKVSTVRSKSKAKVQEKSKEKTKNVDKQAKDKPQQQSAASLPVNVEPNVEMDEPRKQLSSETDKSNSPVRRKIKTSSKQRMVDDAKKARSKNKDVRNKEVKRVQALKVSQIEQEMCSDMEQEAMEADSNARNSETRSRQKKTSKVAGTEGLQQLWDEVTSIGDLPTDENQRTPSSQENVNQQSEVEADARQSSNAHQSDRESEVGGRKSRRAAQVVSYKEKSLNQKLRRGDEIAKSIYSGKDAPSIDIYKSKNSVGGKRQSLAANNRQSRHALATISNIV